MFTVVCLCTPLGCPPLQGSEGSQQNFMGVLETAMKLAHHDADAEDEDSGQRAAAATVETIQILSQIPLYLHHTAAVEQQITMK